MGFSKAQLNSRIERFLSYLESQHLVYFPLKPDESANRRPFIVCGSDELARVVLSPKGGIVLTCRTDGLKSSLLDWIAQENPRYVDRSWGEALAELDTYRYLLATSRALHSPPTGPGTLH